MYKKDMISFGYNKFVLYRIPDQNRRGRHAGAQGSVASTVISSVDITLLNVQAWTFALLNQKLIAKVQKSVCKEVMIYANEIWVPCNRAIYLDVNYTSALVICNINLTPLIVSASWSLAWNAINPRLRGF